jgi:hypothetical protein
VTGSTREKLGVNAVLRLAGTHQFGVEAHVDAGVDRGLAQQRLKEVLGEQARKLGAGLGSRLSGACGRPERQLPRVGQRLPDGHVVMACQVAGGVVDQAGQPELAEDLHAAHVHPPRLGLRRGGRPLLHQDHRYVVGSKEQRRRETDQAAADHQDLRACTTSTHDVQSTPQRV